MRTVQAVLNRLRAEYLEMPGLRLKAEQVQRLCGIDRTMCQTRSLDSLLESKFLCVKSDRRYARLTDGTIHVRIPRHHNCLSEGKAEAIAGGVGPVRFWTDRSRPFPLHC
jgi:hypothetical protein